MDSEISEDLEDGAEDVTETAASAVHRFRTRLLRMEEADLQKTDQENLRNPAVPLTVLSDNGKFRQNTRKTHFFSGILPFFMV